MRPDFDETKLLNRLAYPAGLERQTPEYSSMRVFCQGDVEQLKSLIEDTPFELVDDRFSVEIHDYRGAAWYRGGVKMPFNGFLTCHVAVMVKYEDFVGGYSVFCFGNDSRYVKASAEFLGESTEYANIAWTDSPNRIDIDVRASSDSNHGSRLLSFGGDFGNTETSAVEDFDLSRYLTIRVVPSLTGPGPFALVEIIGTGATKDSPLKNLNMRHGLGSISVGAEGSVAGLTVRKVLGATHTRGHLSYRAGDSPYKVLYRAVS